MTFHADAFVAFVSKNYQTENIFGMLQSIF